MTKQLTDSVTLRHGAVLHNRIVQPPMQTTSGLEGGLVADETIRYYKRRAQSASMIISEFHYVSENGGPHTKVGQNEQLAAYSDQNLNSLTKLAQAMKSAGNKAILQIVHNGRKATIRGDMGKAVYGPSSLDLPHYNFPIQALSLAQIHEIIADFGRATERAIKAGFDGVEIHGANHYLLQQFFSATTNKRTDNYGGSLANRMRFALEVVDRVSQTASEKGQADFIIGYRLSPEEIHGEVPGYTYQESTQLVAELMQYELDYLHLSIYDSYSAGPTNHTQSYSDIFREVLDDQTKLIIIGGVMSEAAAQDALNYGDLVAVGRGILMDPDFGLKIDQGRGSEIVSEISPAQLKEAAWPSGLFKRYTDPNSTLPAMPNIDSIR